METLQAASTQTNQSAPVNRLDWLLSAIFKHPAVLAVISGEPNSGKTDFSLLIAERLYNMGVIGKIASNIETDDSRVEYISSLERLRYWLYGDRQRKLYILDEAIVNLPSRLSMSRQNVETLKIIPEIRKAHARIIVVAQNPERIDKALLDPVWLRALIVKRSQRFAHIFSDYLKSPKKVRNIPPTTIKFDTFSSAPFTVRETDQTWVLDNEKDQACLDWAKGKSARAFKGTVSNVALMTWIRAVVLHHYEYCVLTVKNSRVRSGV